MKKILLISITILFLCGCVTDNKNNKNDTPEWQIPNYEDVINDWARFNSPNRVIADFNSDGKLDIAQIFVKNNQSYGYLFSVNLSDGKSYILDRDDYIRPQNIAIELLEPSDDIWESACEKGYWDCSDDEVRLFKISNPSIYFCYIESACSVFMWSDRKKDFIKIQVSD